MFCKRSIAFGCLFFLTHLGYTSSNPASVDYVKTSIDALRSELKTQLNTVSNNVTTGQTNTSNQLDVVTQRIDALPIITHHVGDTFEGGLVFYVDASQQHGLVVSLTDLSQGIEWRNGDSGERVTNAKAQGLNAGEANTRLIVAEQTIDEQEGQFAALLASSYQVSADGITPCASSLTVSSPCYSGWYLPSLYELLLLHANLKIEFANQPYWSSSEASATNAWLVDFGSGTSQVSDKSTKAHVRAIHTF